MMMMNTTRKNEIDLIRQPPKHPSAKKSKIAQTTSITFPNKPKTTKRTNPITNTKTISMFFCFCYICFVLIVVGKDRRLSPV